MCSALSPHTLHVSQFRCFPAASSSTGCEEAACASCSPSVPFSRFISASMSRFFFRRVCGLYSTCSVLLCAGDAPCMRPSAPEAVFCDVACLSRAAIRISCSSLTFFANLLSSVHVGCSSCRPTTQGTYEHAGAMFVARHLILILFTHAQYNRLFQIRTSFLEIGKTHLSHLGTIIFRPCAYQWYT
jgi:hypothetical protein